MVGLLGQKFGMTQIFDENGNDIPVTILECGPCTVTQVKTKYKDGYSAIQLGYQEKRENKTKKPELGHFKKNNLTPKKSLREFRTEQVEDVKVGDTFRVNNFEEGDIVDVLGTSIGKGYQGVVKRHGFSGGERRHGSKFGREPGSIGHSATPSRVFKGTKLPGQLGNKQVTVQNLKIVKVDLENNLLLVKGNVPGFAGNLLTVKNSIKKGKEKSWLIYKEEEVKEEVKDVEEKPVETKEEPKIEEVATPSEAPKEAKAKVKEEPKAEKSSKSEPKAEVKKESKEEGDKKE